ncbi:hypothetical protein D9M71_670730 [compost metagenome]
MVPKVGAPVNSLATQPSLPWVITCRRFLTSSSTFNTTCDLVQDMPASEVVSVGANSTSKSRLPAMKSSNLVTSSEPAV